MRRKAQTPLQKRVLELYEKSGLSKAEIERRSAARGWRVDTSTLNSVIKGTANPGIKTIEGIALAFDEDPLALMRYALDEPPAADDDGFAESIVGVVWNLYRRLKKPDDTDYIDGYLSNAIEQMRKRLY